MADIQDDLAIYSVQHDERVAELERAHGHLVKIIIRKNAQLEGLRLLKDELWREVDS